LAGVVCGELWKSGDAPGVRVWAAAEALARAVTHGARFGEISGVRASCWIGGVYEESGKSGDARDVRVWARNGGDGMRGWAGDQDYLPFPV